MQESEQTIADHRAVCLDDGLAIERDLNLTRADAAQPVSMEASDRQFALQLLVGDRDEPVERPALEPCRLRDEECAGAAALVRSRIATTLPGRLDTVHALVADAAPNARVVVTGYPRLFSPEAGAYLGASAAEQEVLNDGADQLNAVIRTAAERHGFDFVDVTERFVGHGVNAADPWILGAADPGAFHPTLAGYEAYAAAVTAAIRPGRQR